MTEKDKDPIEYFTGDSFVGEEPSNLDTVQPEESIAEEDQQDDLDYSTELEEVEEDSFEEDVEEVEKQGDEEVDEGYTKAYLFAEDFKKDGTLPEDFEISKDITGEEVKSAILKEAMKDFDLDAYAKSQGLDENTVKVAKAISNGMHPNLAYEVNQYTAIANADIEGDEDAAEEVMRLYYRDKGIDQDTAEDIISNKIKKGLDFEEAEKAQKHFSDKAKELSKKDELRIEERRQKIEESKNKIINKVESRDVKGLNISEKESKDLVEYMYGDGEVDTVMVDGKPQKIMVSKFKKDYNSFQNDPNKFIQLAYNMMKGFDADAIKKENAVEAAVSNIDALNDRVKIKKTKKKKKSNSDLFSNMRMLG